ncbi:MAG: HlyD family type I secretion periplasmic adaptor subunit [Loktanella sp.]|nr:HlyD family type I secretion periplasmic adaptor subunit [Loktanella sp.]
MSGHDFKALSREMAGGEGPRGAAILITVMALLGLALLWASWAELDNVTRGEGRIVAAMQNQMVQAAEGGVILRRHVAENTVVAADAVLFEVDPVDAASELNRVAQRLAALDIREARLRAEIDGAAFTLPQEQSARAPLVALTEQSLFAARRRALDGQLAVLDQRLQQRQQDRQTAESLRDTTRQLSGLLAEEIAVMAPLVRDNIAPSTRLLELQRQREQVHGDNERAQVAIAQAEAGIIEMQTEIANTRAGFSLRAMEELIGVVTEQGELREAMPRLEERVSRTVIRAPMDGIVSRLNFHTPGAVVNAGDVMLELVPTGEALIVAARVMPQDISRIRLADDVRIRLSAYDSTRYGTVDGRVIRISADAVVDSSVPGASHYLVDVAIEGELVLPETGLPVSLLPGMTATVDVLSGKRSVLAYIWQPIARVRELALRE